MSVKGRSGRGLPEQTEPPRPPARRRRVADEGPRGSPGRGTPPPHQSAAAAARGGEGGEGEGPRGSGPAETGYSSPQRPSTPHKNKTQLQLRLLSRLDRCSSATPAAAAPSTTSGSASALQRTRAGCQGRSGEAAGQGQGLEGPDRTRGPDT